MPVYLDGNPAGHEVLPHRLSPFAGPAIHIGLINNMADAALAATERQFIRLLDSAAASLPVRLSLFALPDVPRNEAGRNRISRFYSDIDCLWNTRIDGLIVTGREPCTPNLIDEPYWPSLTRILEWANYNTHSSIWSCLAAHAALLHLDGVGRRRSEEKRCGVLNCERLSDHQLMAGLPSSLRMPHSRWNDIPENELTVHGYSILTRTRDAGVDTFVQRRNSLFVFFQGHPEYESDTLLLEYRRDAGRYLREETDTYPSLPRNYFDEDTAAELKAVRERALSRRGRDLLADLTSALAKRRLPNPWHATARGIYGNWLRYIGNQTERRSRRVRIAMNLPAAELVQPPVLVSRSSE